MSTYIESSKNLVEREHAKRSAGVSRGRRKARAHINQHDVTAVLLIRSPTLDRH